MTLAERIEITGGRATGFDYMQIVLAISIVVWHSIVTSYGPTPQNTAFASHFRPIIVVILPLFFALSGFLVAGSLERTPELTKFIGLRALRILPALATETVMSAFILGPAVTSLPLRTYFHDYHFRKYLYNIVGWIHFTLPGVFTHNPLPGIINNQLWTVPYELECYALLTILAFLGIAQRRYLVFWCALSFQAFILVQYLLHAHGVFTVPIRAMEGHGLVMTFLAGVALYMLRDKVPFSLPLFLICTAFTAVCLSLPVGDFLVPYPAAYMTVYLGLQNPKANALHKLGDLSYGVFLYGFPIQQLVASWGPWAQHWWVSVAIALPVAMAIAAASWKYVEKPTLKLKRHLGFLRPVDAALEWIKGSADAGRLRLHQAYVSPGLKDGLREAKIEVSRGNDDFLGGQP